MGNYLTRERNLTLLTDYYEYTMVNGYFHAGIQEKIAVFDVFFRRVPENGGFAIYAGLQHTSYRHFYYLITLLMSLQV